MEASGWTLVALVTTVLLAAAGTEPGDLFEVDVRRLAALWESEHTSPAGAAALKHADLVARLEVLERGSAGALRVEAVGSSVEGRKIYHAVVGTGPARILFWSQMHGDEPTATSAILDLLAFFARHRKETWVDRILRAYTLDFVPMLNPDGAERSQRRNAQGIDINRDARSLATPEGRVRCWASTCTTRAASPPSATPGRSRRSRCLRLRPTRRRAPQPRGSWRNGSPRSSTRPSRPSSTGTSRATTRTSTRAPSATI